MLALVTARAASGLDPDLEPLRLALLADGIESEAVNWDDESVDWNRFDAAILRSTWDYADRFSEFTAWLDAVVRCTQLINPLDAVRWSMDKHYLQALADTGIAVTPTMFVELGDDVPDLDASADDFVVKPAIGAGSNGARRCNRAEVADHVAALHAADLAAMVQPYLDMIDDLAETSLVYLGSGADLNYDHAFSKAAILGSGGVERIGGLMAKEEIAARDPNADERALGDAIVGSGLIQGLGPLAYARVDLVPTPAGPVLMELELVEPSLYFASSAGSAQRAARAWQSFLSAS